MKVPRSFRGLVKRRFRPPRMVTYGFDELQEPAVRTAFLEHLSTTGVAYEFEADHLGTGPRIRIDERDKVTVDDARASFRTGSADPE